MSSFRFRDNGKVQIIIKKGKRIDGKPKTYYREVDYISKKQLNIEASKFLLEIENGELNMGSAATVQDVYNHFMACRNDLRTTTLNRYKSLYKWQLEPFFGSKKINAISRSDIRNWKNYMTTDYVNRQTGKPISSRTVRNALSFFSLLFNYAIYDLEIVKENPCDKMIVKKDKTVHNGLYSEEELLELTQLLMAEIEKKISVHALGVLIIIFTGIRTSELYGLKWEDIDLAEQTIQIKRGRQRIEGGTVEQGPKTPNSLRTISIPSFVAELLKEEYERQQYTLTAFPGAVHEGYLMG